MRTLTYDEAINCLYFLLHKDVVVTFNSNVAPLHRQQLLFYDNVGLQHLRRLQYHGTTIPYSCIKLINIKSLVIIKE